MQQYVFSNTRSSNLHTLLDVTAKQSWRCTSICTHMLVACRIHPAGAAPWPLQHYDNVGRRRTVCFACSRITVSMSAVQRSPCKARQRTEQVVPWPCRRHARTPHTQHEQPQRQLIATQPEAANTHTCHTRAAAAARRKFLDFMMLIVLWLTADWRNGPILILKR